MWRLQSHVNVPESREPNHAGRTPILRVRARPVALFAVLAVSVFLLQLAGGAYDVERGSYSDEAAHFLNGVLLRDYLTSGMGESPLAFAEEYYLSYPKIAPGAWPPFFHMLLGVFLLPGWPPHAAALVLVGLVTAHAVWRLARLVAQFAPPLAATVVAGLFLFTPVVRELSSAVMVDLVVAAFMIESAYWLARYFATERLLHAVIFGLTAAGACLTKGNGIAVVLTPIVLVVMTRRFGLLRREGLYLAAVVVVVLAVPPLLLSYRFGLAINDFGDVDWASIAERGQFYSGYLWQQLGWLPLSLSILGLSSVVIRRRTNAGGMPVEEAIAATAIAAALFHLLTPYRYVEGRYAVIFVGPLLAMIPAGVQMVTRAARQPRALAVALYVVAACWPIVAHATPAARGPLGFRAAADFLERCSCLSATRILIVSDEYGEGAFVAEVATRQLRPPATIIRSSKMLSGGDWIGTGYQLTYASPEMVTRAIEDLHVAYVVVDSSMGDTALPLWHAARDQVLQGIAASPDRYDEVLRVGAAERATRTIGVYRVRHASPGPPRPLQIDLRSSLGRVLER